MSHLIRPHVVALAPRRECNARLPHEGSRFPIRPRLSSSWLLAIETGAHMADDVLNGASGGTSSSRSERPFEETMNRALRLSFIPLLFGTFVPAAFAQDAAAGKIAT